MKRRIWVSAVLALLGLLPAYSQGGNIGMGGDENDGTVPLATRVLKIENKYDAFHVYLNYSMAGAADLADGDNDLGFQCKQLRLEIKGNITDHLYYRFRHRMNKSNVATDHDNFSKATDYMMVGYRFSPKWALHLGKMSQYWGGYEYDANPMYVYQFSEVTGNMNCFQLGAVALYQPVPSQEFVVEVSNTRNESLEKEMPGIGEQGYADTKMPFTYIFNWNGNFFGDVLQTRWSWGVRALAKKTFSRQMTLGQRVMLPKFDFYLDYTYVFDDVDHLGIISREVSHLLPNGKHFFESVKYHSLVFRAYWRLSDHWSLFTKGMYETASVRNHDQLQNFRKHYGYMGGIEFFPDLSQDLRFSLTFMGNTVDYSQPSGLRNRQESRIELGMMYRIKCF